MQCSVNMEQGNHIPKGELRTVFIPGDIISKFLEVSRDNSEDNLETLGTFGQTGKSDSCTMDGISRRPGNPREGESHLSRLDPHPSGL